MYAVILAGGGGTRLWPLSSPALPKPFLPLLGEQTLLEQTVLRLRGPAAGRDVFVAPADTFVVTDRRYGSIVRAQAPDVTVLEEPRGRNTAAAIALAAFLIDRPEDEVMLVLPADHVIGDDVLLRQTLFALVSGLAAASNPWDVELPLVTLGITPTRPATEYGYIHPRPDASLSVNGIRAVPVDRFEEKPGAERAADLLAIPGIAWNAGMFIWQRRAICDALARYTSLPGLLDPPVRAALALGERAVEGIRDVAAIATALETAYERMEPISIDYAVLEPAAADGRVLMGALTAGWSDIGGWHALLEALPGDGDSGTYGRVVAPGERVSLGPDDLLVHSVGGGLVVSRGPSDPLVLDAHAAFLAGARERAPDVEALIARVARHRETPTAEGERR